MKPAMAGFLIWDTIGVAKADYPLICVFFQDTTIDLHSLSNSIMLILVVATATIITICNRMTIIDSIHGR
ncbi:hypothetical protein ABE28_017235 [Peribacillus muralis]|uniref:Uncharacterized protein n=1 Tax=Peribacillus muralis TaxID=264697 RepID=A0A1B3XSC9_9BACI|nr:hypothetical protein ABE28_017235 [Peribacillus muralis]